MTTTATDIFFVSTSHPVFPNYITFLTKESCRCAQILNQVEGSVILKMSKYLIEGHREIFESEELSETEMVNKFKTVIDFFVNSFEDVTPNIVIQDKDLKEELRIKAELHLDENREEINEMRR